MDKTLIAAVFLFVAILSAQNANALCETYCHDALHINSTCDVKVNDTTYEIRQGPLECTYGCDTALGICEKYPGDPLPGEYIFMFEALAIVLLIFGIYRMDAGDDDIHAFDVILPLTTFIIFALLALQAGNVIDTTSGDVIQIPFITWLNYGLSMITLILFFLNLFKYIKAEVE